MSNISRALSSLHITITVALQSVMHITCNAHYMPTPDLRRPIALQLHYVMALQWNVHYITLMNRGSNSDWEGGLSSREFCCPPPAPRPSSSSRSSQPSRTSQCQCREGAGGEVPGARPGQRHQVHRRGDEMWNATCNAHYSCESRSLIALQLHYTLQPHYICNAITVMCNEKVQCNL